MATYLDLPQEIRDRIFWYLDTKTRKNMIKASRTEWLANTYRRDLYLNQRKTRTIELDQEETNKMLTRSGTRETWKSLRIGIKFGKIVSSVLKIPFSTIDMEHSFPSSICFQCESVKTRIDAMVRLNIGWKGHFSFTLMEQTMSYDTTRHRNYISGTSISQMYHHAIIDKGLVGTCSYRVMESSVYRNYPNLKRRYIVFKITPRHGGSVKISLVDDVAIVDDGVEISTEEFGRRIKELDHGNLIPRLLDWFETSCKHDAAENVGTFKCLRYYKFTDAQYVGQNEYNWLVVNLSLLESFADKCLHVSHRFQKGFHFYKCLNGVCYIFHFILSPEQDTDDRTMITLKDFMKRINYLASSSGDIDVFGDSDKDNIIERFADTIY